MSLSKLSKAAACIIFADWNRSDD